jgi:membrane-associated HD superfamily phosphohydrolase
MRSIYERARLSGSGNAVREEDYRYPGPRPNTPETGILMLADTTEAATRALDHPTPNELRKRIRQILEHLISDGQLDDCALTLKDIAEIEAAFTRVLTLGVYHNRIEYPPLPREANREVELGGDVASTNSEANHDATDRPVRFLRGLADRST